MGVHKEQRYKVTLSEDGIKATLNTKRKTGEGYYHKRDKNLMTVKWDGVALKEVWDLKYLVIGEKIENAQELARIGKGEKCFTLAFGY
jgi:hypothetical protein